MEKRLVGNTTRNSDTAGRRESKKGSKEEEKESNLFLPLHSLSFLSLSIYLCLSIYLSLSFYPVYTVREKNERTRTRGRFETSHTGSGRRARCGSGKINSCRPARINQTTQWGDHYIDTDVS